MQKNKQSAKPKATPVQPPESPAEEQSVDVNELLSANAEFNEANESLRIKIEAQEQELAALRSTLAKSAPFHIKSGTYSTEEFQIGQDGTARIEPDVGVIRVETKTLDDPDMLRKLNLEAFAQEPVTIRITDVAEDQADPGFVIEVNGQKEVFMRGETRTVKRMFVETLARAKKTGFQSVKKKDPNESENAYEYPGKTGQRYPFEVIHDPNPRGRDWLVSVLRQP